LEFVAIALLAALLTSPVSLPATNAKLVSARICPVRLLVFPATLASIKVRLGKLLAWLVTSALKATRLAWLNASLACLATSRTLLNEEAVHLALRVKPRASVAVKTALCVPLVDSHR